MLKKLFILIFSLLCLTFASGKDSPKDLNGSNLQLFFLIEKKDISKNSNSSTERFRIENQILVYEFQYQGYHPDSQFPRYKKNEKKISPTETEKIKSYLNDNKLLKNNIDKLPPQSFRKAKILYRIELIITIDKITYKQTLEGDETDISQLEFYEKSDKLRNFLLSFFIDPMASR